MNDSLDSTFHETVTAYQEVEALGNAIAILEKWRDLSELSEPLRTKQHELLAHMPQRTAEAYETH